MSIQRYGFDIGTGFFSESTGGAFVKHVDHLESHAFDETKERDLFEKHYNVAGKSGIVWSGGDECYRSIRGFNIDLQYAGELTRQLQGWLACAKSRAEQ